MDGVFFRVISLKDEIGRRSSIKAQIDSLSMEFEFFDAVDLRGVSPDDVGLYVANSGISAPRRLTNGEVGCALSHIRCCNEFLSTDCEVGIFVEDDADISRLSVNVLRMIFDCLSAGEADVVIMGYSKVLPSDESFIESAEPIKVKRDLGTVKLGMVWRNWTCGTVAYAISRSGARKFVDEYFKKNNSRIAAVADDWEFFSRSIGLSILHVRPLLVLEKFSMFESSIDADRRKILKPRVTLLDPIRVIRGYIRRLLFWLNVR